VLSAENEEAFFYNFTFISAVHLKINRSIKGAE
jgi:hypothetical protein